MRQEYSFGEIISNGFAWFYTKVIWKKARLIRLPFYCRGKKYLTYGEGMTVGYGCRFEMYYMEETDTHGKIVVGNRCKFGDRVHITSCNMVEIGDDCLFASNILVTDNEHGNYSGYYQTRPDEKPDERKLKIEAVKVGNNVWIGENVVILPGVSIGNGCVIGANSVINTNVEDNCIIAGVPGKIIKKWNMEAGKWERMR